MNSNWKNSPNLESLQKNYPKFEEERQQYKESEKFTWPTTTSYDNNKWYYIPEKPRVEVTEKPPKPSGGGKWKWVADEDDEEDTRNPSNFNTVPPKSIPPNDFSYTFEIPSTDSTPYSFDLPKFEGFDQQSPVEGPSTTLSTSDSEWESPFTSSNGKLKHKSKGNGKGNK